LSPVILHNPAAERLVHIADSCDRSVCHCEEHPERSEAKSKDAVLSEAEASNPQVGKEIASTLRGSPPWHRPPGQV